MQNQKAHFNLLPNTNWLWRTEFMRALQKAHGAPMGENEVALTREKLDWPYPPFEIPEEIYAEWDAKARGRRIRANWQKILQNIKEAILN